MNLTYIVLVVEHIIEVEEKLKILRFQNIFGFYRFCDTKSSFLNFKVFRVSSFECLYAFEFDKLDSHKETFIDPFFLIHLFHFDAFG